MTDRALVREFESALATEPVDLARAALVAAKIEYPRLDPGPTLAWLEELGRRARLRLDALRDRPLLDRVAVVSRLLYVDERFQGNRRHYRDFRNSLLNVVVERRTGIPITLALVYIDVARRADLDVVGVSFPGHFLLRVPSTVRDTAGPIILDPFDGGRRLDEDDCRALLRQHVGDDVAFDETLLEPCTPRQMLARMLSNLKRTYVELRSYPHARLVTELLLVVEPMFGAELRDLGLIAYQLDDYSAALRDLERYLRLQTWRDSDREERDRVAEHVRTLRGQVAGLN
jgi:regulator of sirC expression with transglutaminase-like and TPR domain